MEFGFAIAIGGLYAAGFYMMLRRNIVKFILGLSLLGHGANLLIFTAAGLTRANAPLTAGGSGTVMADPVPQALILTAIVIGFGVTAYMLVLGGRVSQLSQADDVDALRESERGAE
ncbi:MAG TPA: NADH-quinone oxidoreductase subunit K [Candidatus Hydrogenedentes bacterium]|nr:NADH-quinone oxidoreductase subunit K [Candidatus Hydrogenedentota bacterium]HPU96411.1 NADH-quinone oxidoreductase subunit K [Candidatus Hydrogenedentota bacterium]